MLGGKQASGLLFSPMGLACGGICTASYVPWRQEEGWPPKPVCIRSMHCDHVYRLGSSLQGIVQACPKPRPGRTGVSQQPARQVQHALLASISSTPAAAKLVLCMLTGRARHAAPAGPALPQGRTVGMSPSQYRGPGKGASMPANRPAAQLHQ